MPNCVVKGCRNYDTKVKKKDGISYHRFPNDPVRNEIWSRLIRKQRNEPYFKPHKNTRICSAHFCDNDVDISKTGLRRLNETAIPCMPILPIKVSEIADIRPSTPAQSSQVEEIDIDISDLNSIFDSPRVVHLKKRINRLEIRQRIAAKKIKKLQNQNAALKKSNKSLLDIIKDLRQKKFVPEEIESTLGTNAEIAEPYRLQGHVL